MLLKIGLVSLLFVIIVVTVTIPIVLHFWEKKNEISSSSNLTTTTVSVITTFSTTNHVISNNSTVTTSMMQSQYSSILNDSTQTYCRQGSCSNSFYYFQAIQLNISTTGSYIITSNSSMDTSGYIYGDSFIPAAPAIYLISSDDDSAGNHQFMFKIMLQANTNYILVVTTYTSRITGTFSIIATGPELLDFSHMYIPTTNTTTYFNTTATYGTLNHTKIDDSDQGYVVINTVDIVSQTYGIFISNYVEQITFAFSITPTSSKPGIWLYVMNRTGSTSVFTPTIMYQLPYSRIPVGKTGVQTITLPNNALPITQGQYVGVGFDANGGSCYRLSNRNQYYLYTTTFSTLSTASYSSASSGGFAFTFVVRTIGYISD